MAEILDFSRPRPPVAMPMPPAGPQSARDAVMQIFPECTVESIEYFLIKLWALGFKVVRIDD